MSHRHKCPLCDKLYNCSIQFGHSDEREVDADICMGDYSAPCENHTIGRIDKYLKEIGSYE